MNGSSSQVGVVSLFARNNYGNCLQRRAVHALVEEQGYSAVSLDTRQLTRTLVHERAVEGISAAICIGTRLERARRFKQFDSSIEIRPVSRRALSSASSRYVGFIVGSDQVWNPYMWGFDAYVNLLGFVEPDRRIALAPSFGVSRLEQDELATFGPELRRFQRLSCREEEGCAIISEASGCSSEVLSDPTLAVPPGFWQSMAVDSMRPTRPYVLTYMLGLGTEKLGKARKDAVRQGLDLVELNTPMTPYFGAGPAEFVDLVFGAERVYTDSFHAAVFSLIGHVPVLVFNRDSGSRSMSSRIRSLGETFDTDLTRPDESFDWRKIDARRAELRERTIAYLGAELLRLRLTSGSEA